MAVLTLTAQVHVDAPVDVVFGLFGSGAGAGWLFDAQCDRLAPGAAVTLLAPLKGQGTRPVEILGRISNLRPPSRIEIVHTQPWRGRMTLRFTSAVAGSRVSLEAELDSQGLEWLMRRRGHALRDDFTGNTRLGLLTSKSGPGSLFSAATDNMAALALEEINAEGGVAGRPVELIVGDDATDPEVGIAEARRLVRAGCRTLLAAVTSRTFVAVSDALAHVNVLLVQPAMNEGGARGRLRVQLGERPTDQLRAAAPPIMRAAGGRRWFLAGNDYCWPRSTHAAAKEVLPRLGGLLVGERYAPLGATDFAPIVDAVARSGADVVLSTFVGADAAAFQRQCHDVGLHRRCLTLAPAMDESTLARVGASAAAGVHTVSGYLETLDTAENARLLRHYRDAFGRWAPPVSTLTESVYEGVHMWWQAVHRAGSDDPTLVADAMRAGRYQLPRGTVVVEHADREAPHLYLSKAVGTELHVSTFC